MEKINFSEIDKKWQKIWEDNNLFKTPTHPKRKIYVLGMFPYPSGDLHMGHARNYTITDVLARYFRMKGYDVLHPFGWDAFGLPAENAAIKRNIHPKEWVLKNTSEGKEDIKKLGISYDWSKEISTCEPEYYKWTQWLFLLLYKEGLAYRKKAFVNFCPSCQTVLADEQVVEKKCERCKTDVTKKILEQWFFKITKYADRLLEDLKYLETKWPKRVIEMQKNWIGKSEGTKIIFKLKGKDVLLPVFTTRIDTVFGVTFLVIAPEHELIEEIIKISPYKDKLESFRDKVILKSDIERISEKKSKEGIFTGLYAIHPLTNEEIPIYTADYVLAHYGTGIVMGVPAHDQRDFEFAKTHGLKIKIVIQKEGFPKEDSDLNSAMEDFGIMVNSGEFSFLSSEEGIKKLNTFLKEKNLGGYDVSYKIRDWLISRQRYWGSPIPIIHCETCGTVPVPESDLPVYLPFNVDYLPKGKSPLESSEEFINTVCPKCNKKAKRDPDTMDTFVESSWYFLRFIDPLNREKIFDDKVVNEWMPVDIYVGGIEHATVHLIYSRFIHKVLYDKGLVKSIEPFEKLFAQGMVLKRTLSGNLEMMSKRAGNAVLIRDFVKDKGADVARLYILFAGPPDQDFEWTDEGVRGAERFLMRVKKLIDDNRAMFLKANESPPEKFDLKEKSLLIKTYKVLKKVTEDIENFKFNTAIASLMELVNELYNFENKKSAAFAHSLYLLVKMLSPFVPHLAEELWSYRKGDFLIKEKWPSIYEKFLKEEKIVIPIQINGKIRGQIEIDPEAQEEEVIEIAKNNVNIKRYIDQRKIKKIFYVKGKILSFVIE
ncbi:MAG: leucine--tRNA ligase [Candidatus Hydrothermales bacterium]